MIFRLTVCVIPYYKLLVSDKKNNINLVLFGI